ncbi:hypothetical protein C4561_01690 [candidate division WWE3 bacterium]|uniref:ParB/Sulfiredoxin domain-containing protein n=1 Tax=candidate division WWE3 bacterium TaxID=2053526 RepID=A0A3A4ZEP3_UNCKA|nr:MAG: hypothetical protein C4561_01690 [candidate division WWE3 bacterium]
METNIILSDYSPPLFPLRRYSKDAYQRLENSLKQGYMGGIVVNKTTMRYIDGYVRASILQQLGIATTFGMICECSEDMERILRINTNLALTEIDHLLLYNATLVNGEVFKEISQTTIPSIIQSLFQGQHEHPSKLISTNHTIL